MKIIEYSSGKNERAIITAMIVNDVVLARIASKWNPKDYRFSSPYMNQIAEWCVEFFRKNQKAPRKGITLIFNNWSEQARDKDTVALIEDLLVAINGEYVQLSEDINPQHYIDLAGKMFEHNKLKKVREDIDNAIQANDYEKAHSYITNYHKIDIGAGAGTYLHQDEEAILSTFTDSDRDTIIEWPGALGKFFQGLFERDSLISYAAPEKTGKSFMLQETAYQAVSQRRRTLLLSVGDMMEKHVKRRWLARIASWPFRAPEWPLTVKYPTKIKLPDKEDKEASASCSFTERVFKGPLDGKRSIEAIAEFTKRVVKSKRRYFKMHCVPTRSMTIAGIRSYLRDCELEHWSPECIVLDYADILDMSHSKLDMRDQINETWAQLRAISQEIHGIVVTATQTNAQSYQVKTIGRNHFSEDKRKNSHVTATYNLNQTSKEKENQIMRINCPWLRDGESNIYRCVTVAQCLPLANPCVLSAF